MQLGEFGTFRPGIRAKAASAEEDISAENIYCKRIIFTPSIVENPECIDSVRQSKLTPSAKI